MQLVMAKFVIFKAHLYTTVIIDAKSLQIIWLELGPSRKDIRLFFKQLSKHD